MSKKFIQRGETMEVSSTSSEKKALDTFKIALFCMLLIILSSVGIYFIRSYDWTIRIFGFFAIAPVCVILFGTVMAVKFRNLGYLFVSLKLSRIYSLFWALIFALITILSASELSSKILRSHRGILDALQPNLASGDAVRGLLIILVIGIGLSVSAFTWVRSLRTLWCEPVVRKLSIGN